MPVGIVFKGSGFYSTDNRSASGRESRHAEEATGSTPDAEKEQGSKKTKSEKTGSE